MKTPLTLSLCAIFLIAFTACSNTNSDPSSASPSATIEPVETTTSVPTPENGTEAIMNHILLDMDIQAGKMNVIADYIKEEITGRSFMLNRNFDVTKILCDGQEVDVGQAKELVVLGDDYEINLYHLPPFERDVHIEYTGVLDGTNGIVPHTRSIALKEQDTLSPEFTLLRFETICHPFFADTESYVDALTSPFRLRMTINVPKGYMAAFAYVTSEEQYTTTGTAFTAGLDLSYADMAASIAKYQKVKTEFGDFYLLENSDMDISWTNTDISMPNRKKFFNNSWFGETYYPYDQVNIIEVPANHKPAWAGAFLSFIDSKSFNAAFGILSLLETEKEPLLFPKFEGDSCSMLFVGDSYVLPIPEQLQAIAEQYGIDISMNNACQHGATLSQLMDDALEAIQNNQYDFVVVECTVWMEDSGIHMSEVETLVNAAKEKGSTPVLFNVGDGNFVKDADGRIKPEPMTRQFQSALGEIVAKRLGAVLVNAMQARIHAYEKITGVSLFRDSHSNEAGVYHNACVFASTLFDIEVKDIVESAEYQGNDVIALGQAAWEYVTWYKEHQTYPE